MSLPLAETILQNLDEAVCLFDRSGRLVFLNKAAEEFFGKSAPEARGLEISDFFAQAQDMAVFMGKTLAEGRPYSGKDLAVEVGRPATVDLALVPFYVSGVLDGAVLCLRERFDLTEREDLQFDSLLHMLGSIAHEVKNPLSGIKGAAQILKSNVRDPAAAEAVALILRETDRLNAVVQGYLTMNRKPAFHQVNIHEIIEHALQVLKPAIKEQNITITKLYDPSLPLIAGDESKLLQVLINLLKNAVEAVAPMKLERTIALSTGPSHAYALLRDHPVRPAGRGRTKGRGQRKQRWSVITIQDSGPGIPREELSRIFLPYYTRKEGGSGLGLALSKKIIRDHGGIIRVKSSLGSGTAFSVYLPFQTEVPETTGSKRT
ncbi:MAG TPA: ATP-binding protein [Dissulfurispiraceae bacterium]|nr:ATP-binding protein [Dissulfurispiraceae bacterium]